MPVRDPAAVARGLEHGTWLVLADMSRPGALWNGRSSRCAEAGGGVRELPGRVVSKTPLNPMAWKQEKGGSSQENMEKKRKWVPCKPRSRCLLLDLFSLMDAPSSHSAPTP